jgi:tryptophanyl-tRNA synthetase
MARTLRVLSGDRPTGRLHLGHYLGSLRNRVLLQESHECFFLVADLHALATDPSRRAIAGAARSVSDMVLDYLSVGIDPERSVIYLQSAVREVYELHLVFEMLVRVPRLSRLPSLKEMARSAKVAEMSLGLLGYPVLQAADILLPRAHLVPVGMDNKAHVEVAREIARRFNRDYGEVFPVPRPLVGEDRVLVGTDGKAKMSKSLDNAIYLSDDPETVRAKVRGMYTDPSRTRADTPGTVEGNPLFVYHEAFNRNREEVADLEERYAKGKVGDVEVKERLASALNAFLDPLRERRARFQRLPGIVDEILVSGGEKMRPRARETLGMVREAMGLSRRGNRVTARGEKCGEKS